VAVVCISEDPGKEPEHMASINLHIVESRLDYMGSSILMGRVSDLAVKMNDEWHVNTGAPKPDERRSSIATSRSLSAWLGGITLGYRTYHREVMGLAPGRVAVMWLLLGWVTVYGQVNHLGI